MNALTKIRPHEGSVVERRAAEWQAAVARVTAKHGPRPAPGKWGFNTFAMSNEEHTRRFNAAWEATDACQAWDRLVRKECGL